MSRSPSQSSFVIRLILHYSLIAGATYLLLMAYQGRYVRMTEFQTLVVTSAALPLVCGLFARIIFNRRNGFIQFIVATSALILSQYGLGYLTRWKLGIGPLKFFSDTYDWTTIGQLGGGALLIIIILSLWRRRSTYRDEAPAVSRSRSATPRKKKSAKKANSPRREESSHNVELPRFNLPGFQLPAAWKDRPTRPRPSPRLKVSRGAKAIERSAPEPSRLVIAKPARTSKPIRAKGRRSAGPQISAQEEHQCPYCLEPVKSRDPRGVVECDVCHAFHHKDCWDITGMCQVPHLNT